MVLNVAWRAGVARGVFLAYLFWSAAALAQTTVPGKIPGEFAVSPSGAATYRIPIEVPPGVAGMQPQLALSYNSQAGNGIMGMGWNIEGLSAITRCPKTMATDGVRGGVNFNTEDRFCLDGQRLINVSGAYGAPGSEYRTELESFSRITAHGAAAGSAANGPERFTVQTKAGLTLEYGATADSRIEAQGKAVVRVWALNRTIDAKGNAIAYRYVEDQLNGYYYPSAIWYSENTALKTLPQNSIHFEWEVRRLASKAFQAGVPTTLEKRLSKIVTAMAGASQSALQIGYLESKDLVDTVMRCTVAKNLCLPPVKVRYRKSEQLSFSTISDAVGKLAINGGNQPSFGDWNGDGILDVMWYQPATGSNRWYVNSGYSSFSLNNDPLPPTDLNGGTGTLRFGDWNGDSMTDVMWWDPLSGVNLWYTNTGGLTFRRLVNPIAPTALNGGKGNLTIGDWNGDGLSDVLWYDPVSGGNLWYINEAGTSFLRFDNPIPAESINGGDGALHFGDWNGDGIMDVMWHDKGGGGNRWYLNDGKLQFTSHLNPVSISSLNGGRGSIVVGDWNSDGIDDFMWYDAHQGGNRWYLNNGALGFSLVNDPIRTEAVNGGNGIIQVFDHNGDGLIDVLWFDKNTGGNRWFIGKGLLEFVQVTDVIPPAHINGPSGAIYLGDYNADGVSDLVWMDSVSGAIRTARVEDAIDLVLGAFQLSRRIVNARTVLIYPNTPEKHRQHREQLVRVFHLAHAEAKTTATLLQNMLRIQPPFVDERANLIALREPPEIIALAERLVALHDQGEAEVMLEVEVLEVKTSRLTELGINFPSSFSLTPLAAQGQTGLTLDSFRSLDSSRLGLSVAGLMVNLRREVGDFNTLANPRIRSRSKQKATILIGDKVPVITTTAGTNGFVSENVSYLDVGLKLDVEPTVSPDDEVTIKLGLEVSALAGEVRTTGGSVAYQIGTRNANTTLRLRDGETQVLGGLISNEDRATANRVPGLGDLPLAGRLFSSQKDDHRRTELVLAITPRILRGAARPDADQAVMWVGTENFTRPRVAPSHVVSTTATAAPSLVSMPDGKVPTSASTHGTLQMSVKGPEQIKVGDVFTLAVHASSGIALTGVPMDLRYSPKTLEVLDVAEGTYFKQSSAPSSFTHAVNAQEGRISVGLLSNAEKGVSGEGDLILLRARALAAGEAELGFQKFEPMGVSAKVAPSMPSGWRVTIP